MQMDAERHEEQRWKRLKKAADSDAQEAIHDSASSGRNFLDAAQKSIYGAEKGGSSTIEESVRRRTHYLQGRSATDTNAFRRHSISRYGVHQIVILLRSLMNGAALFSRFCSLAVRNLFNSNVEFDHFKHPALHLPLYHVREQRPDSPQSLEAPESFLEALHLDDARVKFLNSRLTKINLTSSSAIKSGHLIDGNSVSVPLNPGESLGIANYYTRIGLGTPPTYHLVVVDTGSSFSWIQCEPCTVYCHPQVGSRFDPAASQTYQLLSCDTNQCSSLKGATLNNPLCTSSNACVYTATYGDQSFSMGYLSKDSLTFGTESLPGFVFGCGQDNDGLFGKSAGLVGLAKNELSMLSQLSTKYGKVFSYCLPTATPLGETGSGDSGTTISRLAGPVYSALREELVKVISSKYKMAEAFSILDACFIGSINEISSVVPSVQMIFQGGAETQSHNVVIEVEKGTTCLSFAGNSNLRDIAIIGNQQQQTFEIVYDLASSRIGFAAGGCR
ncbi:UNVERIFIED_CONTAM: Aspartyl protease family protein 2 [Sesamum calycinum]|uniref:Aspartyl protease family protein 2 n=1 Tax=Sesamum calycinum TaxID=2727403 RepID=A0AAW2Q5L2_9LAMI